MKLSDAKLYLPFVQAAAEGKVIQNKNHSGNWHDSEYLDFYVPPEEYRIKPTSRS